MTAQMIKSTYPTLCLSKIEASDVKFWNAFTQGQGTSHQPCCQDAKLLGYATVLTLPDHTQP